MFLKHLLHLVFLKGISRLIPLITIPLLMRTIGLEQLGLLKWVEAMADYFLVLIGYGFRYTATKKIATCKEDPQLISQLLGAVYAIKLVTIILSGLIMLGLIWLIPQLQALQVYFLTYFLVVITSMLFPCFVFQGLDQLHWMTWINLFSKLVFILSIIGCVRGPSDALLYHHCLAFAYALRLVIAFWLLYYKWGISIARPTWILVVEQLQEGIHIFLAQLATNFYGRVPTIFLGFFVGPLSVATYVIGTKAVHTLISMIEPFTQAIYPIASKKLAENRQAGLTFVTQIGLTGLAILLLLGILFWYLADPIVELLADKPMPDAVQVLQLHAWLPCIVMLTNLVGIAILLPLQAGSKYTLTMLLVSILCVGLHGILVPQSQVLGAAWAVLLTEIVAAAILLFWAYWTVGFCINRSGVIDKQKYFA